LLIFSFLSISLFAKDPLGLSGEVPRYRYRIDEILKAYGLTQGRGIEIFGKEPKGPDWDLKKNDFIAALNHGSNPAVFRIIFAFEKQPPKINFNGSYIVTTDKTITKLPEKDFLAHIQRIAQANFISLSENQRDIA